VRGQTGQNRQSNLTTQQHTGNLHSAQTPVGVENRDHFSVFGPVKIRGGISEWLNRVRPTAKLMVCLWRGLEDPKSGKFFKNYFFKFFLKSRTVAIATHRNLRLPLAPVLIGFIHYSQFRLRVPTVHQRIKFQHNLAIYGWVIDDFSTFSRPF